MKANRSNPKPKRQDYCFAAHPISIETGRQFTHNYVLYFEKDLHIFGRYEFTEKELGKKEKYYFQFPSSIQTFQVTSGEELEFKWSLYMQRTLDNYHHEEYMQTKKANLKWCWEVLQTQNKTTSSLQAMFGMAKIKFNYVFILATSQEQIFKELETYYKENRITPTKIKKLTNSPSKKPKKVEQQSDIYIEGIDDLTPLGRFSRKISADQREISSGVRLSTPIVQSGIEQSKRRSFENPADNTAFQAQESQTYSPNKMKNKLKYSISELEAVKDMQKSFKETEGKFLKSLINPQEHVTPMISGVNYLSESKEYIQQKKITSSQIFNAKGEVVITPFYLQLKYWLVIFGILFIFIWLVGQGPKQMKQKVPQKAHSKHSREKPAGKKQKNKNQDKKSQNSQIPKEKRMKQTLRDQKINRKEEIKFNRKT